MIKNLKTAPVRKSPVKKTPAKKSPVRKSPVRKSPVRKTPVKKSPRAIPFGKRLSTEQLRGLAQELQSLRNYPPLTQRSPGRYEGDILGFVKGLRLSARVIYFLREFLSGGHTHEVSWGHLIDKYEQACSPECDVIIHKQGLIRKWNGFEKPIMEFSFISVESAKVVISCKSNLTSIDERYPSDLQRFGVNNIVLLAECCKKSQFKKFRAQAKSKGYKDLFVIYFIDEDDITMSIDDQMHIDFCHCVQKLLR